MFLVFMLDPSELARWNIGFPTRMTDLVFPELLREDILMYCRNESQ